MACSKGPPQGGSSSSRASRWSSGWTPLSTGPPRTTSARSSTSRARSYPPCARPSPPDAGNSPKAAPNLHAEELLQSSGYPVGGIFHSEVPGVGDQNQVRVWKQIVQAPGEGGVEPGVLLSPYDIHGSSHRTEEGFELRRVLLVELRHVVQVVRLPILAAPLPERGAERRPVHWPGGSGPQVRDHGLLEDVVGHRAIRLQVDLHVPGGGGDPRSENHRVDEGYAVEGHLLEQVGTQHDRPAYVVGGDRRRLEAPRLD